MIEFPEASVLTNQINQHLLGKSIVHATANYSPHKFAWYNGDPDTYSRLLKNQTIQSAIQYGGMVEIRFDEISLCLAEGVRVTYVREKAKLPVKHQLLLEFSDQTYLVCTIQMYGGLWAYPSNTFENPYYLLARNAVPLTSELFSLEKFQNLAKKNTNLSLKAFLATEQRLIGLGNGVLQNILWQACLHPKTKVSSLKTLDCERLHNTIQLTLKEMILQGGRDTETSLFGEKGTYETLNTMYQKMKVCPRCGSSIQKEAYMGGSIYYCPICQPKP